jgi:hypothetical protein
MRALNSQIWSFKHPDFLAVNHGTAQLALYDRTIWDKYQLTSLAGDEFKTNTLITEPKAVVAVSTDDEGPAGSFSFEDNSIPALMRRGIIFMSCHNAIWEQAAILLKSDINPDKLSHAPLAAGTDQPSDGRRRSNSKCHRYATRVATGRFSLRNVISDGLPYVDPGIRH